MLATSKARACWSLHAEFDEDNDGHLTAVEITHALQSRGVDASEDQVQEFINGRWPGAPLKLDLCAGCTLHTP
jgi:Ca2+-binding EF-hand superfamily protein